MWKVNQIYRHDGINYVVVDTVSDGDTLKTATLLMVYGNPNGPVLGKGVKISSFSGYTYVQDASDAVIAQAKKIYSPDSVRDGAQFYHPPVTGTDVVLIELGHFCGEPYDIIRLEHQGPVRQIATQVAISGEGEVKRRLGAPITEITTPPAGYKVSTVSKGVLSPTFREEIIEVFGKDSSFLEGVKHDKEKPRPSLLFRSLNKAVHGVLTVLEFGAKKYAVDNWKKIEPDRYKEALGRHYLAIMAGEKNDPESGLPHIDHLLCCALFISEMEKQNGKH